MVALWAALLPRMSYGASNGASALCVGGICLLCLCFFQKHTIWVDGVLKTSIVSTCALRWTDKECLSLVA